MSLREYLHKLDANGQLVHVRTPISKTYEVAGVLKRLEPTPVLFERVKECAFPVVGNLFCDKPSFAAYFGIPVKRIIPTLIQGIDERTPCEVVREAPCQEVVCHAPDLDELPILRHCYGDGGNYVSAGVMVARHPTHGLNLDFHRLMQISKNEFAVRVVARRHFDTYLRELGQVDVAVCVGCPPNVLAAAATSVDIGVDEL